ncbi:hypothetical protein HNR42_001743 [Deinobacterium chartae]|uniref:Lipoprotein n=1 Tax=Deinobacterium chartae TaxID=521158 RepID=A0A841I1X0_9DEIO|nr:hypothetical protein [Deinobacterium chartae]MBB6098318.1 hypothetical protein [Deinobacterium chartae]
MRNQTLLLLGASTALLAGCGAVGGIGSGPDVLGAFTAADDGSQWPSNTRVALVGVSDEGLNTDAQRSQLNDPDVTKSYALDLPASTDPGIYRVVGWVDENGDGKLNVSEIKGDSGSKYLIYAERDRSFNIPFSGDTFDVKVGWNLYDTERETQPGTNPSQPSVGQFTGVNLKYKPS